MPIFFMLPLIVMQGLWDVAFRPVETRPRKPRES